jgi:hypothetical protein
MTIGFRAWLDDNWLETQREFSMKKYMVSGNLFLRIERLTENLNQNSRTPSSAPAQANAERKSARVIRKNDLVDESCRSLIERGNRSQKQ